MKYTPGPWEWGDGWGREHNFGEGSESCDKYMDMRLWGANGSEIIPIRIDHYEPEWDCPYDCEMPNKADRKLIAAAPDLMDAAQALIADVRKRYPGEELRCPYMQALDKAIAKAENRDL